MEGAFRRQLGAMDGENEIQNRRIQNRQTQNRHIQNTRCPGALRAKVDVPGHNAHPSQTLGRVGHPEKIGALNRRTGSGVILRGQNYTDFEAAALVV